MKAKVKNDTLFKLQPVLSSDLDDSDKVFVPSGSEYELKFFTEAAEHHLRLELANATFAKQKGITWYVDQSDIDVDVEATGVTATALQDTVLKLRPAIASDLNDAEKAFVAAGTELQLHSHAPAGRDYTKLTLADERLGNHDSQIWFANTADIQITGQQIMLKVVTDTLFKARPTLAGQLSDSDKVFVPKQRPLALQSYHEVEGNHLKVTLTGPQLKGDRLTWYAFAPDVEITGTDPYNQPQDTNPAGQVQSGDRGQPLNLPGFPGTYFSHDPIIAGGYFTWAQATHGGTRIPVSIDVIYGMIRIAEALEEIRVRFGNQPIEVVSWYRDPATNLRVGGSKHSRHITGDGVNFVIAEVHPHEVYAQLDDWWGARGGLGSAPQFTHIDARGYRARWSYQF